MDIVIFFCKFCENSVSLFIAERKKIMLEFYPNPVLTHQGLLQGHHHDSITNSMSCNGHGRTGICLMGKMDFN